MSNQSLRSKNQLLIEKFMAQAKQELPTHPTIPGDRTLRLRARLILEEALETCKALGVIVRTKGGDIVADEELEYVVEEKPSLVGIVDGCADIEVVTLGTMAACGMAHQPIFEIVMVNNLEKFGPGHSFREDGKLIKPADHVPPTGWIEMEIERQRAD